MHPFLSHLIGENHSNTGNMMDNGKSDSPESVPSMAETSMASDDGDDVARALFVIDESHEVVENIQKLSEDCAEDREVYGSEISITSSETTIVTSWNLSPQDPSEEHDGRFPTVFEVPRYRDARTPAKEVIASYDKENNATHNRKSPTIVEEPPEEAASCNGALSLTPRQLADIFLAFEARTIWPMKQKESEEISTETPATPPSNKAEETDQPRPMNPSRKDASDHREESLGRECAALKRIIQNDSSKLLNLKRAMEAQRELNTLKEIEIDDRQLELQIADQRIEALKREKELFRERESELVETIRILKEEVDKLSRYKCTNEAEKARNNENEEALLDESEFHDLEVDIQLFSSQIVEQELAIAELRSTVEEKSQENQELKNQLKSLQAKLGEMENEITKLSSKANSSSTELPSDLGKIIENISKRLEAVEKEKHQAESNFSKELNKKDYEIDEIRNTLILEKATAEENLLKISQDPDEIEVLLPRQKEEEKAPPPKIPNLNCCCDTSACDAWRTIARDLD
jgi:uncharacterized coiled-coil protein SlyX